MKKTLLFGALCVVLAFSFISCDGPESSHTFTDDEFITDNEFVKVRKEGKFKKIPDWIKGYWSDDEEQLASTKSYFFTDTNFFFDWIRAEKLNMTTHGINQNPGKFTEDATDTSYTVTFTDYYSHDADYETHTKKDWVFKFEKSKSGISLVETNGDTVKDKIEYTKGKLLLPKWIRNTTWASENGLVELKFTETNLVIINKSSGISMDFTDTILPNVNGLYYEYILNKGYTESSDATSYSLTITDGETTLDHKFVKRNENTITWTIDDSSVDMGKKSAE